MDYLWAFLIGGLFCAIGQVLMDFTKLTPARILVAYVTGGVLLGALGLYKPLIDLAGCGATVPLTGFGYLLYNGVREQIDIIGFLGIFTGGLTASAAGITAAMTFAFIFRFSLKAQQKNSFILTNPKPSGIIKICKLGVQNNVQTDISRHRRRKKTCPFMW